MILREAHILPIISFILWLHESEVLLAHKSSSYISRHAAEDLIACLEFLIDKPLNENNTQHVISCLRDRKASISPTAISRVIKLLIHTLG